MAIFPQFEWIEIDGRMVPLVKPQHYKKGSTTETELTGHDNPLPVANYTQNDSGIWLPTSKDNPMPTQLTGSNDEYSLFEGQMVTAGSQVYEHIKIQGNKIGISSRIDQSTSYSIELRANRTEVSAAGQNITVVEETSSDRGSGALDVHSKYGTLFLINNGSSDFTVAGVLVTNFT